MCCLSIFPIFAFWMQLDWDHIINRFQKFTFSFIFRLVHTKPILLRFQIFPRWRAFSLKTIHRFHRFRVDGTWKRNKIIAICFISSETKVSSLNLSHEAIEQLLKFSLTLRVASFGNLLHLVGLRNTISVPSWTKRVSLFSRTSGNNTGDWQCAHATQITLPLTFANHWQKSLQIFSPD